MMTAASLFPIEIGSQGIKCLLFSHVSNGLVQLTQEMAIIRKLAFHVIPAKVIYNLISSL